MQGIVYKSMISGTYKSDEAGAVIPSTEEQVKNAAGVSDDGSLTEEQVLAEGANAIANQGDTADSGDVTSPFARTVGGGSTVPGTKIDEKTGSLVTDANHAHSILTIDEVLDKALETGFAMSVPDFEQLEQMYLNTKTRFEADRDEDITKLNDGGLTNQQASDFKDDLALIEDSLNKINYSLEKIKIYVTEYKATYAKELENWKIDMKPFVKAFNEGNADTRSQINQSMAHNDINGDGYFGEPGKGIKIVNGTTKGTVLYDENNRIYIGRFADDGTPLTTKFYGSGKTWTVTERGLAISETKKGKEDLTLTVDNPNQWTELGNPGDAKMAIAFPDAIAMLGNADGDPIPTTVDGKTTYTPLSFKTNADGSIVQDIPSDLSGSNIVWLRPDEAKVTSIDNGHGGFDQIIKIYSKRRQLCEIRLTSDDTHSASDYSLAFYAGKDGSMRTEPIVLDAASMMSTGTASMSEETMNKLFEKYKVDLESKCDDNYEKAYTAFWETMNKFKGQPGHIDLSDERNAYLNAGGAQFYGLSGYLRGSDHGNNIAFTGDPSLKHETFNADGSGANDLNKTVFIGGNAAYNAFFDNSGANVFATGVTAGWIDSTNTDATLNVQVKGLLKAQPPSDGDKTNPDNWTVQNINSFLYMAGGDPDKKTVDNMDNTDTVKEKPVKHGGTRYFNTGGEATYHAGNGINVDTTGLGDIDADTDKTGKVMDVSDVEGYDTDIKKAISEIKDNVDDPNFDPEFAQPGAYETAANDENSTFFTDLLNYGFISDSMSVASGTSVPTAGSTTGGVKTS